MISKKSSTAKAKARFESSIPIKPFKGGGWRFKGTQLRPIPSKIYNLAIINGKKYFFKLDPKTNNVYIFGGREKLYGTINAQNRNPHFSLENELFVFDSKQRGNGIGSLGLQIIENNLKEKHEKEGKTKLLKLTAQTSQKSALMLFLRNGYSLTPESFEKTVNELGKTFKRKIIEKDLLELLKDKRIFEYFGIKFDLFKTIPKEQRLYGE